MADFTKLIEQKDAKADYMVSEITHICKDMPKRGPGMEGERQACEYLAGVLKNECGCTRSDVESFKENPGSFMGWIYITITCALLATVLFFFMPILGVVLLVLGFTVMILQFGMYIKFVDKLFPEKTGTNVTAIRPCTGEVKGRVFFNGHPDAAWNWPVNCRFGGAVYEGHIVIAVVGALLQLACCIAASVITKCVPGIASAAAYGPLFWVGVASLIFVPFEIGMYFMWDENTIVDGANDNLTACLISVSILKALEENDVKLENVEVGVILSGSEEAGLRGAKAWCEAHKGEFDDVPTWIYSYDTIHDPKFLMVNYRDLNGTVKADKEVSDSFYEASQQLGIHCNKGMVPPFGGATDSAAFAQAGFRATGITGL
ncbi:MAG: M28 family peptidase, partial [Clostridia bacterium]|nr:M28 family peptidase [Clostridia bacterium]